MSDNGLLTIKEASQVFNINQSTIYKYIQQGRIQSESLSMGGIKIKKVRKQELEQILNGRTNRIRHVESESESDSTKQILYRSESESDSTKAILHGESLRETLKAVVKETITEERSLLMKPLEEQSLYIAGALTKENQFLKERLETILEENKTLREQIKALPGPAEEINEILLQNRSTIQEKEVQLRKLDEEKKELEARQEEVMKELEAKLKAEAEEQIKQVADAWKKELEQARRPWWKLW